MNSDSSSHVLGMLEATESNLIKLEKVWNDLLELVPDGIDFTTNERYDELCFVFDEIAQVLPEIDGWKLAARPMGLQEIAQGRLDVSETERIEPHILFENEFNSPKLQLNFYRLKLNQTRKSLTRTALESSLSGADQLAKEMAQLVSSGGDQANLDQLVTEFDKRVDEIYTLVGSRIKMVNRWTDLVRHLHFRKSRDINDIINFDWPSVHRGLLEIIYDNETPTPIKIKDLNELRDIKAATPIPTKLNWSVLSPEDFERLIYSLISSEKAYENTDWLMNTNAPDRGRDISTFRVISDSLSNTDRQRIIVQCKHWLSKSISISNIAEMKEQIKLWEPPRVDLIVFATSGRFTSDAVASIELYNQSDSRLKIEMWPESHLERLLAARPHLIAEFKLR